LGSHFTVEFPELRVGVAGVDHAMRYIFNDGSANYKEFFDDRNGEKINIFFGQIPKDSVQRGNQR
jgi:hypothetical protein